MLKATCIVFVICAGAAGTTLWWKSSAPPREHASGASAPSREAPPARADTRALLPLDFKIY
jgi:hypothetical protein